MASAAVTPRVRNMVICDGARESQIEAGVFNLKGVCQRMVANAFPFAPPRLWLFLVLTSPRAGVFPGYVAVVNNRTDKAIFIANLNRDLSSLRMRKLLPVVCDSNAPSPRKENTPASFGSSGSMAAMS